MRSFIIDRITRENQEKLQLLIKSNMISIKINERLSAKNYKSIINLIEEKSELAYQIEELDESIVKNVNKLKNLCNLNNLGKLSDEEDKSRLANMKESSFRVLKQMQLNKNYDEKLARGIFLVLNDKRYVDLFLR